LDFLAKKSGGEAGQHTLLAINQATSLPFFG
jgi:hypothetical protein